MGINKRIGILGSGAAGLCAARHSVDAGYDVVIFDQQADLGGTWLFSPEINSFSSLYEKMYTNLPKEIMGFEHLPFETNCLESFVRHEEVLSYLRRYGKSIRHLIHFNTQVTKINQDGEEWKVTTKPVISKLTDHVNGESTQTFTFDVLFICNGHFSKPRIPEFAEKLTQIPWIHCHNYRRPHGYKGKEIAVIGAGPSGVDVAIQLGKYAKKVHMLHNQEFRFGMPENVVDNARLIDIGEDGKTLLLENGEKLSTIEAVIFCTGYFYDVPFCEKDLIEAKDNGRYLYPLYQDCINAKYPESLFFIGVCVNLIPFLCFDLQVHYALAIVDGTSKVPSAEEMDKFQIERLRLLKERGRGSRYFHSFHNNQWQYFDTLAKLAKCQSFKPVIREIYEHVHEQRSANLATFKSFRYKIVSSEKFEVIPLVDLDCN